MALPPELDEDSPHRLRRNGQEMRTILPMDPVHIEQADICLVDERRRLKRMVRPFTLHVALGEDAQFLVNERDELVER
jgi:hypothetical protein